MRTVSMCLLALLSGCAVGDEGDAVPITDAGPDVALGRPDLDLGDDAPDAARADATTADVSAADALAFDAGANDVTEPDAEPVDIPCHPGETFCPGGCVDLSSSTGQCGVCGVSCVAPPGGSVACVMGACVPRCPTAGQGVCGGVCVDRQSNDAHCGACGHACGDGERCMAGRCLGPSSYRVRSGDAAAMWVDACAEAGHQTLLTSTDAGTAHLMLPFAFRYWGVGLAAGAPVVVSVDGYVTFQDGTSTPADGIVPNALDGVNAVVAAQWRNLRTRSNGVCVALVGNPGARRWVIQWSDARYFTSDLSHLNFEIVLNEGSSAIDLVYASQTLPEPATVALEDWEGARSSVPFTIPQPILFSNSRARFTPQ